MELKLTQEKICINEVVFNGSLEQSIELDYLLPDYCKSIFKILKCKIVPKITNERIQNGKLIIEGVAQIKVLYVSEDSYKIRCIMQKQAFTKSMELKENYQNGCVTASVKCDYVNCRATSQTRLDIRGALTIKATVSVMHELEILSKASGMGVQVYNKSVTALDKKLYGCKEFSIREELEIAYGKPSIDEILDSSACAVLTEYKVIANKVIAKGEIMLHILYCADHEDESPQIMDFTIPISQVLDVPGINEDYRAVVDFDVVQSDLVPRQNNSGECKCIDADFCIRIKAEANKNAQTKLISDIYSTDYMLNSAVSGLKIEQLLDVIGETTTCKATLSMPQGELSCVYDISCDYQSESCRCEDGEIKLVGNLCMAILALDCDNMPVMIEKTSPCEMKIPISHACENIMFTPHISITSISYHLISASEIEVCASVRICGCLYETKCYNVLTSITVDESSKKECCDNAVLRLYFASKGESVWSIAKHFNTSMEAVMLQNSIEGESLNSNCMLLIPIIK